MNHATNQPTNQPISHDLPIFRFTQVVTMEGELQEDVLAATKTLEKLLPEDFVVKVVADDDLMDV